MSSELEYLDSLQASGIRPGLARMRTLLRAAGNPHRRFESILVAGTNGKGSVAATLASIFTSSGYETALYTSPHLLELRERWMIGGEMVSEGELEKAVHHLQDASARCGIRPTYFEALTLIAFILFAAAGVQIAILEVGMGGRLDATNVVRPLAAVITSIGLDHTEYLGNTLRKIAREKAGIIHRGSVALTSNEEAAIVETIERRASKLGVPLHQVVRETTVSSLQLEADRTSLQLGTTSGVHSLSSPLAGIHQVRNLALAVRTAEEMSKRFPRVSAGSIEAGVAATKWRGRFERFVLEGRQIFVDGAHNADAAEALAPLIEQFVPAPRTLVFGIMRDKDFEQVIALIFPLFDRVILTVPYPPRSAKLRDLEKIGARFCSNICVIADPGQAVLRALGEENASIVICGSLYLAGAAIALLDSRMETMAHAASSKKESRSDASTIRR